MGELESEIVMSDAILVGSPTINQNIFFLYISSSLL